MLMSLLFRKWYLELEIKQNKSILFSQTELERKRKTKNVTFNAQGLLEVIIY